MSNQEPTNFEILEFLQENMATKEDLAKQKHEIVDSVKVDLAKQKHEILDSMDEKLNNLKGDLVIMMRKEDKKVTELITLLATKGVIATEEADRLLALEPFPQM